MKRLIIKYTILIIVGIVTAKLLTAIIMTIWPNLLSATMTNGVTHILSAGFLEDIIEYIINIVFIFILYKEMNKENFKSLPILIMTFFSGPIGVILFLLTVAYQKISIKQII